MTMFYYCSNESVERWLNAPLPNNKSKSRFKYL
jgi:hypothetical protein